MNKDVDKRPSRSTDGSPAANEREELDKVVEAHVPSANEATKREIVEFLHEQRLERSYAGPLPPPYMLRDYDSVVQNGAERIMAMAEKE